MSLITGDDRTDSARLQLVQPKSYTLAELETLAKEFIGAPDIDNYERRLLLSVFITWLKQREKEGK